MPDASFHLTLAFLGEAETHRAQALIDWVETLEVTPGRWRLDTWGCFRGPRILWVGGQTPDAALAGLQARLWENLEAGGFSTRPSSFLPHVTLLRRPETFDTTGLPDFRLDWPYNRLALIHSTQDASAARYATLARSRSG